jgi:hypothetical protein
MGLNVRYIHFRYKPRAPTKVPVTYCRDGAYKLWRQPPETAPRVWHMPLI